MELNLWANETYNLERSGKRKGGLKRKSAFIVDDQVNIIQLSDDEKEEEEEANFTQESSDDEMVLDDDDSESGTDSEDEEVDDQFYTIEKIVEIKDGWAEVKWEGYEETSFEPLHLVKKWDAYEEYLNLEK
jgi:hypothetical protein